MSLAEMIKKSLENFFEPQPITTDRLYLRKLTLEDASDMFEYSRDPDVSKYTVWDHHASIKDTKGFLNYILENYSKGIVEDWGIVYKENNKLIGTCGFFEWDKTNHSAHIHYALSKAYAGKGLMTETVKAIIDFGFEKMNLNRIEARCMPENIGSERVMQKSGLLLEGIARESLFAKGIYKDLKVYAIIRKDLKGLE